MTLCSICGKSNGIYLIKNLSSDEQIEILICEFCEPPYDFTLVEDLSKPKEEVLISEEQTIELNQQERTGRLHIVNKTKKVSICRICRIEIPVGSKCYDQNVYEGNAHFPRKLKVCFICSQPMIAKGVKVV